MMTSFLLVKSLKIAMMCQDVNVEGLEAYVSEAVKKSIFARGSILEKTALSRYDFPWRTSD